MPNILWLKKLTKKEIYLAGGKGANLGELYKLMPIPKGFCVTTDAFEEFIDESGLKEEIYSMLQGIDLTNKFDLDTFSAEIREMIISEKMPEDMEKEIIHAYKKLDKFVAVRSSATAEDLPEASFAGQHDTYLNVNGKDEIIKAVKNCWASLFSSRAISYREAKGFNHEDIKIAVIIQNMIDSDKAGVMFTANPVNQHKTEIVIEGSYGLGESVVAGKVTPDTYILMKNPFNMISANIGSKETSIVKGKNNKNQTIKNTPQQQKAYALEEKELRKLVDLGIKIEQHFQYPQDIEWAIKGSKIYILQSRPITTLNQNSQ